MITFLVLPAIAWEKLNTLKSIKKGIRVARIQKIEFASGFVLTDFASAIVFIPPFILFILSGKLHIEFPDYIWFATIAYCSLMWSFSLFLEQIFVAELYLWHLIWEKEAYIAKKEGRPIPKLRDVKRPSLMDDIADLDLTNIKNKS